MSWTKVVLGVLTVFSLWREWRGREWGNWSQWLKVMFNTLTCKNLYSFAQVYQNVCVLIKHNVLKQYMHAARLKMRKVIHISYSVFLRGVIIKIWCQTHPLTFSSETPFDLYFCAHLCILHLLIIVIWPEVNILILTPSIYYENMPLVIWSLRFSQFVQ